MEVQVNLRVRVASTNNRDSKAIARMDLGF